jgi:hypothetical protein
MIEVYAFLAMFAVQILAMSVLFPAQLIRYAREQATNVPAERLARLYPGVDHNLATKRFLSQLHAGSAGVAVIGLLALGWLFRYMRQPDWDQTRVITLLAVYGMLQYLPLVLAAWVGYRFYKTHEHSLPEGKRKAMLERRGLFDFIAPSTVFLAVLAYFLFVAFVIYVQRKPFPGFALIGVLTLVYALQAFDIYRALYGKKSGPLDTHALRVHRISFTVKLGVYICILNAVFFAFVFTVDLLDLKKWVPFAISVAFVTITVLISTGLTALLRQSERDKLGSNPV